MAVCSTGDMHITGRVRTGLLVLYIPSHTHDVLATTARTRANRRCTFGRRHTSTFNLKRACSSNDRAQAALPARRGEEPRRDGETTKKLQESSDKRHIHAPATRLLLEHERLRARSVCCAGARGAKHLRRASRSRRLRRCSPRHCPPRRSWARRRPPRGVNLRARRGQREPAEAGGAAYRSCPGSSRSR
jgi:hypothetical protein